MFIEEELEQIKTQLRETEAKFATRLHEAEQKIARLLNIAELPSKSGTRVLAIQTAIAEAHGVSAGQLYSLARHQELIWPRHLAFYIARAVTGKGQKQLALEFNRGDHTSISYGCKAVADRMSIDPAAKAEVEMWLAKFSNKKENNGGAHRVAATKQTQNA